MTLKILLFRQELFLWMKNYFTFNFECKVCDFRCVKRRNRYDYICSNNYRKYYSISGENRAGLQLNSSPSMYYGMKSYKERFRHSMLLKGMFGFVLLYSILLFSEGSSTNFVASYVPSNSGNNNSEVPTIFETVDNLTKSTRSRN